MSVRRRSERGSASLYVVALVGVTWLAGVAALLVGQALTARHQAAAAADLAALAAADHVLDGPAEACRHAESVAAANGAALGRCTIEGEAADVSVILLLRAFGPLRGLLPVSARARAGPADGTSDAGPAEAGPGRPG
jgi:secretion/DNA translocation related TadE-like protein